MRFGRRSFGFASGAVLAAALVAGCSGGDDPGGPIAPAPAPTVSPSATASSSILKAGQDGSLDTCSSTANACVIQGQTIVSTGWVPIICDQATNPTCTGAGTWQFGATPVGSNSSVTWTFAQPQILPNQEQSFTVATQTTSPLATYSFAISSVWNPPAGPVDHSFTGTVQVMCSLRDGSCGATPSPNASVICLPTPAPESGAAAGGFAERRKPDGSASGATPPPGSIVYVSPC